MDDPDAVVMVGVAGSAEHHGPEAMDTHLDAGAAEDAIAHGKCSLVGCSNSEIIRATGQSVMRGTLGSRVDSRSTRYRERYG